MTSFCPNSSLVQSSAFAAPHCHNIISGEEALEHFEAILNFKDLCIQSAIPEVPKQAFPIDVFNPIKFAIHLQLDNAEISSFITGDDNAFATLHTSDNEALKPGMPPSNWETVNFWEVVQNTHISIDHSNNSF